MSNLWKRFFRFSDDKPHETYAEAVERAKGLMRLENYEDACKVLRYAEREQHAEAMFLLAWCYWNGQGVTEDTGRALDLWQQSARMGYRPALNEGLPEAARQRLEEVRL